LAGYEDVNDAERLSQDPTFRLIGSEKIWERGAALPSRLHWFETEVLSRDENLEGLSRISRELLAKAEAMDSRQRVVLDMDSTEIPVYGEQEHSAYNGHFESTCYHPLLLFNGEGDCLTAKLRPHPEQLQCFPLIFRAALVQTFARSGLRLGMLRAVENVKTSSQTNIYTKATRHFSFGWRIASSLIGSGARFTRW
jgi:hypothetical protein